MTGKKANENLGNSMIFNLTSTLKEWLDDNNYDKKELDNMRIQKEFEELEERRKQGTPVTRETFLNWAKKFYNELNELEEKKKNQDQRVKLTGRQLFERSPDLALSDASFVEQGDGESVSVDWSIFSKELENADIGDED